MNSNNASAKVFAIVKLPILAKMKRGVQKNFCFIESESVGLKESESVGAKFGKHYVLDFFFRTKYLVLLS